jgi:hypothetical protein
MRLISHTAFLIIVLFAAVGMAQQPPAKLGLDFPVPAWPANGVVPADMKDKFVFVDLSKNEYIVAFPENLGSTDYEKDGPGSMKVSRFELLRDVQPVVSTAISPMNGGKLRYTYEVANGSTAKQSIDQWSLIIPKAANASAIKFPDGWMAVIQPEREFKVLNPDWIKTGAAAIWSFKKPEQVIQAGDKKTGFILESDLRPGFTLGYFRKAESVDVTVASAGNSLPAIPGAAAGGRGGGRGGRGAPAPETPPVDPELQAAAKARVEALKDQIDEMLRPEYNSKTVLMIGPKFAKDTDVKTVAADFVQGLTLLSQTGGVDANSAFVKDVLEQLKAVESSGNASAFKPAAQPTTPAETQVFNALKVSLQAN